MSLKQKTKDFLMEIPFFRMILGYKSAQTMQAENPSFDYINDKPINEICFAPDEDLVIPEATKEEIILRLGNLPDSLFDGPYLNPERYVQWLEDRKGLPVLREEILLEIEKTS